MGGYKSSSSTKAWRRALAESPTNLSCSTAASMCSIRRWSRSVVGPSQPGLRRHDERSEVYGSACPLAPAHRLAFLLAAYAGLRAGEVRGLRWRDVDLEAGRLVLRQAICCGIAASPKFGHERIVPLASVLLRSPHRVPKERRDGLVALTVRREAVVGPCAGNAFRRMQASRSRRLALARHAARLLDDALQERSARTDRADARRTRQPHHHAAVRTCGGGGPPSDDRQARGSGAKKKG